MCCNTTSVISSTLCSSIQHKLPPVKTDVYMTGNRAAAQGLEKDLERSRQAEHDAWERMHGTGKAAQSAEAQLSAARAKLQAAQQDVAAQRAAAEALEAELRDAIAERDAAQKVI